MITLELKPDEINQIVYALTELANKRQEQSLDYHYNTIAKRANADDAARIRILASNIRRQTRNETKK